MIDWEFWIKYRELAVALAGEEYNRLSYAQKINRIGDILLILQNHLKP